MKNTKQVVINKKHGGYGISQDAIYWMKAQGHPDPCNADREDPLLIECIQILGENANGDYAKLVIVDIPDDVEYTIEEYDGLEWIAEVHRTWH